MTSSLSSEAVTPSHGYQFKDKRRLYQAFVHDTNEKQMVASRLVEEIRQLKPEKEFRLFDAGVGDGTVLAGVMQGMHHHFKHLPFYIVGKEISVEDVRLVLQKMPDRFVEHPATVLVLTNLPYVHAPWMPLPLNLVWEELELKGQTSYEFGNQIQNFMGPFLAENWEAKTHANGNTQAKQASVLVISHEDHKDLLENIRSPEGFDYGILSQPYQALAPNKRKARVIAPIYGALKENGQITLIHSHGQDPAEEIVGRVWPHFRPYRRDDEELMEAVKAELLDDGWRKQFQYEIDPRLLRYEMHHVPGGSANSIVTPVEIAAWDAAAYATQVDTDDPMFQDALNSGKHMEVTHEIVQREGGLWLHDRVINMWRGPALKASGRAPA